MKQQNHLKTVALTAMFISVLFLTGCGKKVDTTNDTITPTTNTQQQTDQEGTTNNGQSAAPEQTQASSTTTPDTTTSDSDATASQTLTSSYQIYKTPGGDEEIQVTATIDSEGIVKDVKLAFNTHAAKSKQFQGLFTEGIAAQVVGKSIKDINVGVVNGSSLTGKGFNLAIDEIEAKYYANAATAN